MDASMLEMLPLWAVQGVKDTAFKSIANSDSVGKFILLVLLGFSVASWTVMIGKWISLRRAKKESLEFLEACKQLTRIAQWYSTAKRFKKSPLSRLYKEVYSEVQDLERSGSGTASFAHEEIPQWAGQLRIDALQRAIDRAIVEESGKMEQHLSFLATCTTICPFLGLFGTVWGILDAFQAMATMKTVDVTAMTPGISAALTTTVAGLLVAIPAVMGYNGLLGRVQGLVTDMELLGSDIISFAEKKLMPRGTP